MGGCRRAEVDHPSPKTGHLHHPVSLSRLLSPWPNLRHQVTEIRVVRKDPQVDVSRSFLIHSLPTGRSNGLILVAADARTGDEGQ